MVMFFILLLVPIMLQCIATRGHYIDPIDIEKKKKNALAFFFLLLTVLVMFRHESVGTDTESYIYYFERFSKMDRAGLAKEDIEIGFAYFNKIISLFSKEPQFYLAAAAIVTSAMIYPTYKRLCADPSLTIVLFCIMSTFVMMFSGIRQMLAVGIGFIAYEFVRRKKLIPFVLAVCIAMTFHTSAFMLAFMYPFYHAKITRKWLYAVVPALTIIFIFNKPIFSALSSIIEQYTKYDGDISSTGAYTMLILFILFAVFVFLIPDESRIDKETIGLRNFLLFSLALQMFAPLHTLAMRMNYYYIIFIPLLLPKIISYSSKKWEEIAVAARRIMVVFFLVYFFSDASNGSALDVFPYHFFWEAV